MASSTEHTNYPRFPRWISILSDQR
jgi:hypothetical protein